MKKRPIDYLILVNPFHKIPETYFDNLELVEMRGYDNERFRVEKSAAQQFRELERATSAKGIPILLSSAYRSVEKQRQIKEEFTAEYGEDYAKRYVAEPGCSEHHTGLALDFVAKIRGKWLIENDEIISRASELQPVYDLLPKYGFILRYLKGKEKITGYPAEPWHIRYLGDPEIAAEITARRITLEEYCEQQSLSATRTGSTTFTTTAPAGRRPPSSFRVFVAACAKNDISFAFSGAYMCLSKPENSFLKTFKKKPGKTTNHLTINDIKGYIAITAYTVITTYTAMFLDSEPEVITSQANASRRREPLRGSQADATIRFPDAQSSEACS